jgi:phospholipase C
MRFAGQSWPEVCHLGGMIAGARLSEGFARDGSLPPKGTPSSNGLTPSLLHHNQNLSNPQRLDRSEAVTCDQDHDYGPERQAFDHGLMDKFVQGTGSSLTRAQCDLSGGEETPPARSSASPDFAVMDYCDGNTVTGLWNYAQHFAMSDNSYGTTFDPSTPGALNLVSGGFRPTRTVMPTTPTRSTSSTSRGESVRH